MKNYYNLILLCLITGIFLFTHCKEEETPPPSIQLLGQWAAVSDQASGCDDPQYEYVNNNPDIIQEFFPDGTYSLFVELTEFGGPYLVTGNTILYQFPQRTVDFEIENDILTTVWFNEVDGCTYTTIWEREED